MGMGFIGHIGLIGPIRLMCSATPRRGPTGIMKKNKGRAVNSGPFILHFTVDTKNALL